MQLRKVSLRDWKCYAGKIEFSFPAATDNKNICLIGAANGFGKTALYEAIVLGLFGRDGMPLLYRARFEVSGDNQNDQTYVQFLSRTEGRDGVLNRTALAAGVTDCSVELVFDDEAGRPVRLQRIWHFTQQGALKRYEEEVQAFEGHERRPVGPRSGMATANDRLDWFRDWIAKTFVPYYLGWFFLFDGEMVKTFADQGMREQVRNGIEGLLGLPLLRDLATDLRNYARVRGGSSGGPQNGTIEKAEGEEEALTQRLQEVTDEEKHVDADLRALEAEREELTRVLHGLTGCGNSPKSGGYRASLPAACPTWREISVPEPKNPLLYAGFFPISVQKPSVAAASQRPPAASATAPSCRRRRSA